MLVVICRYEMLIYIFLMVLPMLFFLKPKATFIVQAFSSLVLLFFSAVLLLKHEYNSISMFHSSLPYLDFSIKLDSLSLLFVMIISTISLGVSTYSLNYVYDEDYHHKRLFAFIYTAFIASLLFVVTSFNAISFLIFWEIMSTLSFFLVIYNYENEENRQGGFLYIFMTHLGTAFIMVAFILMYLKTGSFSFENWVHVGLDDSTKFWVFLCVLIGFGTKAGMFPLHVWLPKAHPVAPSNVSALMSGVMIKTAIYMMIRFYFYFLSDIPWWYGFIVLLLGSLSALFGVMYALAQHDLKRLLAYHSIENIGIILMGLGSAMLFNSNHMPLLASFGLLAAIFHTYNHAIFKSLLFLGSGATFLKTHTKDMEKYGGLIKLMPYTALFFIIGSISISALPPFNGFVSEWLTYQSLLLNNKIDINIIHIFVPLFASMLALTGAFAAACFVKVIGISFLGSPRSDGAKNANEVGKFMVWGMGFLAALCVVFGLFPHIVIALVAPITSLLLGVDVSSSTSSHLFMISTPNFSFGHLSTLGLSMGFAVGIFMLYILIKKFGNTKTRMCSTWGCGQLNNDASNQYTASGFSQPIRKIFAFFYHPKEKIYPTSRKKKYFFPILEYKAHSHDGVESVYNLVLKVFVKSSAYLINLIENGSIHIYLLYILIASIAFLVYAVKGGIN